MSKDVSIRQLRLAIEKLKSDKPVDDERKWYTTQKEHWIGWLKEYHTPGAYNRKTGIRRNAQFAYNHIVEPKMLLWLAEAAGIEKKSITAAKAAKSSSAIRRIIPWQKIEDVLF